MSVSFSEHGQQAFVVAVVVGTTLLPHVLELDGPVPSTGGEGMGQIWIVIDVGHSEPVAVLQPTHEPPRARSSRRRRVVVVGIGNGGAPHVQERDVSLDGDGDAVGILWIPAGSGRVVE